MQILSATCIHKKQLHRFDLFESSTKSKLDQVFGGTGSQYANYQLRKDIGFLSMLTFVS